jgi:hypothetical protein
MMPINDSPVLPPQRAPGIDPAATPLATPPEPKASAAGN